MGDAFRVNLFRKPFETDEYGIINPEDVVKNSEDVVKNSEDVVKNPEDVVKNPEGVVKKLNAKDRRAMILDILKKNNCITAEELSRVLQVSHRTVQRDIDSLKSENKNP